ncbi:RING/U-box superfamily protein [Hirschfeldia incana]|nr:RING/U-box superfamily protein [Hirschfeldia incana]
MISDSITNASASAAPSARDMMGKKKRTNRAAKLKQSKLGLRREQWLSQAMINKGDKEDTCPNRKTTAKRDDPPVENLDGQHGEEEAHSFMESLSNSPNSILNPIPDFSSGSSSGSGGSCSGNITEEEDAAADDGGDEDGCLDDWEAFADALAADEEKHEKENPPPESCEEDESLKQSSVNVVAVRDVKQSRKQKSNQAWRADDQLRPQGLPNLGKQRSFPVMNVHFSSAAVPSSCPICYEDLDLTDSSFLPCPCGFRLCLFCHKTICDGDGRCPGCRKPYEKNTVKVETSVHGGGLTIRLARSSSMFCRS